MRPIAQGAREGWGRKRRERPPRGRPWQLQAGCDQGPRTGVEAGADHELALHLVKLAQWVLGMVVSGLCHRMCGWMVLPQGWQP